MSKLRLLGAAAVLCSVLSGPAMAKHVISSPRHSLQKTDCQNRDPGNPYSERYDYQAWTAWRANGGWDSRRDWDCWYGSRRDFKEAP
jgi:hypothetical protein